MSDESVGALVCGFSDLAAGTGGLAWSFPAPAGLLMSDSEVEPAKAELGIEGETVNLGLVTDSAGIEAELVPRAGSIELPTLDDDKPPGGPLQLALCTATIRSKPKGMTLQCTGHVTRWAHDPFDGAGTFRHLVMEGGEGALLLVTSIGASGAAHGDEETRAWLIDGEGHATAFAGALLSTQYDDRGRPTRTGLELWPEGEEVPPMRAAGTRMGGADEGGVSAALLRSSIEGVEGLGSYLVIRR